MTTRLETVANRLRRHVLTMSHKAQAPHVAAALSCVEILATLYFRVARLDPKAPQAPDRDRIILSKGHAAAALYACLAERGFFPVARLLEFAQAGSVLAEHPSYGTLPGIEATSGSLGHGLGIGLGMAVAARLDGRKNHVYVILSDGECNEGSTWEAALWAPAHELGNVTAIIDYNKLQATGRSTELVALAPLPEKWRSFGWEAVEVDGHDPAQLVEAFEKSEGNRPKAVIAHTVKGKGVSFMENDLEWHYRPPSAEDLAQALDELEREGV